MQAGIESGLILVAFGLALIVLVWVVTRWALRSQPSWQAAIESTSVQNPEHHDAVMLIHRGGRVEHVNAAAEKLFGLVEDESPNLERFARQTHPSDSFWKLCAFEGQARFSIEGKLVEGVSYRVAGSDSAILLSLRQLEFASGLSETKDVSASVLKIVTDFGQSITENLNVDATLNAVIENVEKLVSSDVLEVKVKDQTSQVLTSYHFGNLDGSSRLESNKTTRFGNYSAHIAQLKKVLFVSDTQLYEEVPFFEETEQYSIRSYIGIPLLVGDELVGVLEVGKIAADAYSQEDVDILQLISGQIAIAIRNALLYENEQQRAIKMSSLANLGQSTASLQNREKFFAALVNSIQPLFDVEILGFLLYDEDRRILAGQVPFKGIPAHVVNMYYTEILADSLAEELINTQEILFTQDAKIDKNWEELRLHNIAQATSLRESALVPLLSDDHFLGYLQFSNHSEEGGQFTKKEENLMNIVAKQMATIITNANLVQQTRLRAQRAEIMQRVATLVSSSVSEEETVRFSVQELAQFLHADSALIFLFDEEQDVLSAHKSANYGVSDEKIEKLAQIYPDDLQYRFTVTGSRRSFLSSDANADIRSLEYYRPLMQILDVESVLVVPLIIRESSVGEMVLGSFFPNFFTHYDLQAANAVAEQLALALEASKISAQTDEDLRLRVDQLTALSRVSRELNSNLSLKYLLQVVYDEGLRTTKADCGTIIIFDQNPAIDEDRFKSVLTLGCTQGVPLTEIELEVAHSGTAFLVEDAADGGHPANHEGVRSALIAPIAYQGKTVGLFHLHSMSPHHFDEKTLELVQTLAVQAAIAMGNAYRYEEQVRHGDLLERQAETLSSIVDTTTMLEPEQPLRVSLKAISQGIAKATPFEVVLMSVYDGDAEVMRHVSGVGLSDDELASLQELEQPFWSVQQLLKPEFKIGNAYYIPVDENFVEPSDLRRASLDGEYGGEKQRRWHSDDLFLFLLNDQNESPLGMISLARPSDGMPPNQITVDAVEVFAAQSGLIISSQAHLMEFEERVSELSAGLNRQERLLEVSQNNLPVFLHKDLEQTIVIQNLDRAEQRIQAGLKITESVSRQLDVESALRALGNEILTQMGMTTAFAAENALDGPRLLHSMGDVPGTINPDALFGQRNPLRACLQTGETLLIMNLDQSEEWRESSPLLNVLQSKSFIALPIKVDGETVAAVLAVSRNPLAGLSDGDEQIYHQIARQTSIIFQNIYLLTSIRRRLKEVNLLRDFSRTLNDLSPSKMTAALLKNALQVISTAEAGIVLMWNEVTEYLEPDVVEGYADTNSMEQISYRSGEALPGKVFSEGQSRNVSEINFNQDYTLAASQLLLYRQAVGGRLPISSLLVPIQAGDYSLGVLVLDNFNKEGAFQKEDEALLFAFAQQVALSLQNLRLLESTEERARQLESLTDVATAISSSLESDELIPFLLVQLKNVIPYDRAILWLEKEGEMQVVTARGFADNHSPIELTSHLDGTVLIDEILHSRKAIFIPDVRDDERFRILNKVEYLSWLGIPLLYKGQAVGIMMLEKKEASFYSLTHIQVGITFSGQAAVALENARLFEDSRERTAELNQLAENLEQRVMERTLELEKEQRTTKTLLDILTEVSASLDLDLALNQTLALLNETVEADQGTIMLLNPEDNRLHYRAGRGYLSDVMNNQKRASREKITTAEQEIVSLLDPENNLHDNHVEYGNFTDEKNNKKPFTLQVGKGLAGWVFENQKSVLIDDLEQDKRWIYVESDLQRHRSAIASPLMVGEDVIGVLLVFNREVNFFNADTLKLVSVIAGQVAVVINNANLYKLIREQAERLGNMLRSEQEEASRSHAILEAVADGVLVTDSENRISFINASAENILGIKSEKVISHALKEFSGLFGKAANIWHEIIRRWSKNLTTHQEGDTYAEQLELDDGRIVLVHLAPVMLVNQHFLGTVSIFRDITHEVEIDRMKSDFVATVSHELRTPMTSIRGYVDILLMGAAGTLSGDQTHFLEIIRNNTERLNILVTDLLDVSRLESGRAALVLQPIILKEIVEDVLAHIRQISEEDEKPMNIFLETDADLPLVYADAERLWQIISNLIENAYHYTPKNGQITILLRLLSRREKVQISIRDNGIGIAPKDQEQVFERFYRGDDPLVLATPGTGLGLPIVKQLIEMHKGKIWVESSGKVGEGSIFSFTLPVYKKSE